MGIGWLLYVEREGETLAALGEAKHRAKAVSRPTAPPPNPTPPTPTPQTAPSPPAAVTPPHSCSSRRSPRRTARPGLGRHTNPPCPSVPQWPRTTRSFRHPSPPCGLSRV